MTFSGLAHYSALQNVKWWDDVIPALRIVMQDKGRERVISILGGVGNALEAEERKHH